MSILKLRRRYENVALGGEYPEPWLVSGHPLRQFLYRALLGRPMDGRRWTDATFWRTATHGEPSWWLRLAGWQRMSIRVIGAWETLLMLPLLIVLIWPLERYGSAALLLLLNLLPALIAMSIALIRSRGLLIPWWSKVERGDAQSASLDRVEQREHDEEKGPEQEGVTADPRSPAPPPPSRFYERWEFAPIRLVEGRRTWERDVVQPLARALAPQLPRAYHPSDAAEWCIVPRDYASERGQPVRILLPGTFTGVDERANKRLTNTIRKRLALDDMVAEFRLENTSAPELRMVAPPAPPTFLSYADVRTYMAGAKEYEPFLGMVTADKGLHIQMVGDGPHTALSAGTGAGKTTLLKLLTCQFRAWGWLPVILDWKRSEANSWAWDLPGVRVLSDIEAIHDFGVQLGEEIDYRRNASPEERVTLPRIVLIRNEWNATAELLMTYWQDYRATLEPADRARVNPKSPAMRGYANVAFCGRELNVFDVVEAQRLSARVFNGNADVRENYRNLLMARYSYATVRMLIGDPAVVRTFPKAPKEIGRWTVKAGEDVHKPQIPYLTNEEAREFALSGKPGVASPWSVRRSGVGPHRPNDTEIDSTQGGSLGHDPTRRFVGSRDGGVSVLELTASAAAPARRAKLSDIAEELEYLDVTLSALQNERKRDPSFPKPVGGNPKSGYLYDVDQVTEYVRRRHARMAAERAGK